MKKNNSREANNRRTSRNSRMKRRKNSNVFILTDTYMPLGLNLRPMFNYLFGGM